MTGLTYWRCPVEGCRTRIGLHDETTTRINSRRESDGQPRLSWGDIPHSMRLAERLVEAHEARHMPTEAAT